VSVETKTMGRPGGAEQLTARARAGFDDFPGFGPMTRISTDFGAVPAQALRVGDRVRTRTGVIRPIVWLDRIVLDEAFLARHPGALPILIRAGAFGPGLPARDVTVAPGQPVGVGRFRSAEAPRPARMLTAGPGALRKTESMITYTRFHCGQDVEVDAERLWMPVAPQNP